MDWDSYKSYTQLTKLKLINVIALTHANYKKKNMI